MFIAQIIGNIGRDAEVKNINGKDYISFSVASTEKENGEEVTRWVSVLGSINNTNLVQYLKKGQQVFVSGRYSDKMYTHQNGVGIDRQIFTGTIHLCGGKKEEGPVGCGSAAATPQTNQAPYGSTVSGNSVAGNPVPSYQTVAQQDAPFPPEENSDDDSGLPF